MAVGHTGEHGRQDLGDRGREQGHLQLTGDAAGAVLEFRGRGGVDVEDPLGVPGQGQPGVGELDPPADPPQQRHPGGPLQRAELLGHRAGGVAERGGDRGDGAAAAQFDERPQLHARPVHIANLNRFADKSAMDVNETTGR
jgi:hypothetical protein